MKELFLEIGCEEIPAGFIGPALNAMTSRIVKAFNEARIEYCEIKTAGTPRRLILTLTDVAEKQKDIIIENQGPAKKVAFDEDGNPTRAMEGFARGQGLPLDKIEVRETPKGEYLYAVKEEKGVETSTLLPAILEDIVASVPFKKSMRWKDLDITFARPVHWILAIFAGETIDFSFGDVHSGNISRGHRFHAPAEFEVKSFADYTKKCRSAYVIADPEERKLLIGKGVHKAASAAGGLLIEDEGLLEEVANLVEYPVVVCGSFDDEYLKLPKDVVINAMRDHQRYFSVEDEKGKLMPLFITVSNTEAKDMQVVKEGNERVLRARLSDAAFYYYEDLKKPLDEMVESLKSVVFQAKLGTSFEKVERFSALAGYMADQLVPDKKDDILRAAHLAKADLVSGVVGEFAKLQGVMGRDYALKAGERPEVAEAIFEHYLPRNAGDILPTTDTGAIVSIADKMETLCSCFGIGLIPTGAADPYALRRQTLGVINILLDKEYHLSISEIINTSLKITSEKIDKDIVKTKGLLLEFIKTRLSGLLTTQGYSHDIIDAVLTRGFDDIVDAVEIIKALSHLKGQADFEPLAVAFKRVANITREFESTGVDPSLFEGVAEKELHAAFHAIGGTVTALADKGKYKEALLKAAEIRPLVDKFFDDILVMVESEKIRDNRLSLLKEVSGLFTRFADFSKIVTENK
ncbi:MAG: glycine--tRNA ligase subunit beta [Proteobacteria bacterium]|nr:glycine--tRNA ligase subunit beta [Pseudomonadota bacterium]